MLNKHTAYKYETPYTGPFVIKSEVTVGSLMAHRQIQNGMGRGDRGEDSTPHLHPPGRPRLFGSPSKNTYQGSGTQ